jgi:hypothetical protein
MLGNTIVSTMEASNGRGENGNVIISEGHVRVKWWRVSVSNLDFII